MDVLVMFGWFLIETVLSWIMLLIVIPIAHRFAEFSLPPWNETWWKLGVTAMAMNAVALPLDYLIHPMLGWAAGMIVLWILLAKWLDVDGFGMWVIIGVSYVIQTFVIGALMAVLIGLS